MRRRGVEGVPKKVNLEKRKYIWVVYDGKWVADLFGFWKINWKLLFTSGSTNFFGVILLSEIILV